MNKLSPDLSKNVNTEELFNAPIEAGTSIAPGLIFAPCRRYENFIRLSFGHPWSGEIEEIIQWLGKQVQQMAAA